MGKVIIYIFTIRGESAVDNEIDNQSSKPVVCINTPLSSSIDNNHTAFETFKAGSDNLFTQLHQGLSESEIKIVFLGTTISFQFNQTTKIDIYKSKLVYFGDGFNSLLQDKGSGIQSVVSFELFNYYTRIVTHSTSSLLAVEEPEPYLHPQYAQIIEALTA